MIHLSALPGTPGSSMSVKAIAKKAAAEARLLAEAGFDALMIENMHDAPYMRGRQDPAITAAMAVAAAAVREAAPKLPLGIQVLACGHQEALGVALAVGGSFIRVENFVFAQVADEGLMAEAEAGPLLRYRRSIGAGSIALFADIDKKHASHSITADVEVGEIAGAAEFFGADGVIVTGIKTGSAADTTDIAAARKGCDLPVLVGSGVTPENIGAMFEHADAVIVGSYYKRGGVWNMPPDAKRAKQLIRAADAARR